MIFVRSFGGNGDTFNDVKTASDGSIYAVGAFQSGALFRSRGRADAGVVKLSSGGDTLFSLVLDVGTLWLVGVTSAGIAALVLKWPLEWVYACTFLEEAVKMAVGIPHFQKKTWMNVLTAQPEG